MIRDVLGVAVGVGGFAERGVSVGLDDIVMVGVLILRVGIGDARVGEP